MLVSNKVFCTVLRLLMEKTLSSLKLEQTSQITVASADVLRFVLASIMAEQLLSAHSVLQLLKTSFNTSSKLDRELSDADLLILFCKKQKLGNNMREIYSIDIFFKY